VTQLEPGKPAKNIAVAPRSRRRTSARRPTWSPSDRRRHHYEQQFVTNAATSVVTPLTGGGHVFAGPRDDPFFVDLGGIFDLAQIRPVANPAEPNRDSVSYMNVHAIVLEIPLAVANGGLPPNAGPFAAQTVGVWASASRKTTTILRKNGVDDHIGPWVQVSRLGLPLINEAVIASRTRTAGTAPAERRRHVLRAVLRQADRGARRRGGRVLRRRRPALRLRAGRRPAGPRVGSPR